MGAEMKELDSFVRRALAKGETREAIASVLEQSGWSADQTRSALNAYSDVPFVIPVPRPRASLSAREAFLYLVMFTSLYFSAYHLGSILFDFVDQAFPDPSTTAYWGRMWSGSRWSVSSLIISFPIFLFLANYTARENKQNVIKRLSGVRRWITYITLFIASSILIGDATSLIYHLLGGELTIRFVLKSGIVALIAGTIFGYYLSDLRRDEKDV